MTEDQAQEKSKANTIENLEEVSSDAANTTSSTSNELAAKVEECTALNEKYLRLAAEFENYKRLTQRDQREQIRFGNEQLLKELLPVVDNLERAIKAAQLNSGDSALVQGVELTLKQLNSAFEKGAIKEVNPIGEKFDPHRQQAMTAVESDKAPNTVVHVLQKGYVLHDRVLRPALVTVAKGAGQ